MQKSISCAVVTSCQRSKTGAEGFQVLACSDDISSRIFESIVFACNYKLPKMIDDLSTSETPSKKELPIKFKFCGLNNRPTLIMSLDNGKDHTGRSGNYFAYALMFHNFHQIKWWFDYYDSDIWLTADKFTEEVALSVNYTISKIKSSDINRSCTMIKLIKDYIKDEYFKKIFISTLQHIYNYIFKQDNNFRLLIISNDNRLSTVFIAALTYAFPYQISQNSLTFSTYEYTSNNDVFITATTSDYCESIYTTHGGVPFMRVTLDDKIVSKNVTASIIDKNQAFNKYASEISQRMQNNNYEKFIGLFSKYYDYFNIKCDFVNFNLFFKFYKLIIAGNQCIQITEKTLSTITDAYNILKNDAKSKNTFFNIIFSILSTLADPLTDKYAFKLLTWTIKEYPKTNEFNYLSMENCFKVLENCYKFEKPDLINEIDRIFDYCSFSAEILANYYFKTGFFHDLCDILSQKNGILNNVIATNLIKTAIPYAKIFYSDDLVNYQNVTYKTINTVIEGRKLNTNIMLALINTLKQKNDLLIAFKSDEFCKLLSDYFAQEKHDSIVVYTIYTIQSPDNLLSLFDSKLIKQVLKQSKYYNLEVLLYRLWSIHWDRVSSKNINKAIQEQRSLIECQCTDDATMIYVKSKIIIKFIKIFCNTNSAKLSELIIDSIFSTNNFLEIADKSNHIEIDLVIDFCLKYIKTQIDNPESINFENVVSLISAYLEDADSRHGDLSVYCALHWYICNQTMLSVVDSINIRKNDKKRVLIKKLFDYNHCSLTKKVEYKHGELTRAHSKLWDSIKYFLSLDLDNYMDAIKELYMKLLSKQIAQDYRYYFDITVFWVSQRSNCPTCEFYDYIINRLIDDFVALILNKENNKIIAKEQPILFRINSYLKMDDKGFFCKVLKQHLKHLAEENRLTLGVNFDLFLKQFDQKFDKLYWEN